jgi:cytochrome c oxidase subunit 4
MSGHAKTSGHGGHHVVPVRVYLAVFAALLILTAITTAAAFRDLGPFNTVAALGIAVLKATLVVLFFMHVKYSTRLTGLVIAAALCWMVILVALTLGDYWARGWLGVAGR